MAISLKHSFTSPKSDGTDTTLVQPSNWNAEHVLTLASSRLVGRTTTGTGAAEEISVGSNLSLATGTLNLASTVSLTALTASGALTGGSVVTAGSISGASLTTTGAISGASLAATGAISGATIDISGDGNFNGTGAVKLPNGTTAQRPTPVAADIRFNSSLTKFEGYDGTAWNPISTLTPGTAVASTSGTAINFTGIPAWAKRITIILNGVSTNAAGSAIPLIQIGPSGGIETTGYSAGVALTLNANQTGAVSSTAGFPISTTPTTATVIAGALVLLNVSGNTWVATYAATSTAAASGFCGGGVKTLAGVLTQVRITTSNGTDAFDAGSINIMWE